MATPTRFEFPRMRDLLRNTLPGVIEGSVLPVVLFVAAFRVTGLWGAIVAGLGFSYFAIGRPLAQRIASNFCPIPEEVLAHRHVQHRFLRISLLFSCALLLNAAVALWLQFPQSVETFVLVKPLATGSITIAAVVVSVVWFERSLHREGLLAPATVSSAVSSAGSPATFPAS